MLSRAASHSRHASIAALLLPAQSGSPSSSINPRSSFFVDVYLVIPLSLFHRSISSSPTLKIWLHRSLAASARSARSSGNELYPNVNYSSSVFRETNTVPQLFIQRKWELARIGKPFQHRISPRLHLTFMCCEVLNHHAAVHPCKAEVPFLLN